MVQNGIDTTITNNQTDGTIFLQTKNSSGGMVDTLSINSGSNGIVIQTKLDMNSQILDQIGSAVFVGDSTTQTSAYTGAGALTGSYTNTNMTINNDGKITAIASGSTPILSDVLTAGNSAGSTSINMNGQDITNVDNIDLTTINGAAYPPVTGAGTIVNGANPTINLSLSNSVDTTIDIITLTAGVWHIATLYNAEITEISGGHSPTLTQGLFSPYVSPALPTGYYYQTLLINFQQNCTATNTRVFAYSGSTVITLTGTTTLWLQVYWSAPSNGSSCKIQNAVGYPAYIANSQFITATKLV